MRRNRATPPAMNEEPKRLKPRPDTLRKLFLLSGNLCAFPNCAALIMNANGVFIVQLCHIEAAERGGPRFNPEMTNEQRRAADNLMLMCYPHHQQTNDQTAYPTRRLAEIKRTTRAPLCRPRCGHTGQAHALDRRQRAEDGGRSTALERGAPVGTNPRGT